MALYLGWPASNTWSQMPAVGCRALSWGRGTQLARQTRRDLGGALTVACSHHQAPVMGLPSHSAARGNEQCLWKVLGLAFRHPETDFLLPAGRIGRPWNTSVARSSHPGWKWRGPFENCGGHTSGSPGPAVRRFSETGTGRQMQRVGFEKLVVGGQTSHRVYPGISEVPHLLPWSLVGHLQKGRPRSSQRPRSHVV